LIKSFKHKGLKKLYYKGSKRGIQAKYADKVADILDIIDAATEIGDINFPGSYLHLLQPKKDKIWAVTVSGGWRITFKFDNGDAYIIDYKNYH
jgi:proteic killer suppression protein